MRTDPERLVQVWKSPVQVLPGGVMQVQPHVAALIAGALEAYARMEKVPLSPFAQHVAESARYAASLATSGHADVRKPGVSAESAAWTNEAAWMTTTDAARELGCSREHAGRLARSGALGETRVVKKKRLVLRAEVAAMAADRRAA